MMGPHPGVIASMFNYNGKGMNKMTTDEKTLKIGKTYKTLKGDQSVLMVAISRSEGYDFIGEDNRGVIYTYTKDGMSSQRGDEYNIVIPDQEPEGVYKWARYSIRGGKGLFLGGAAKEMLVFRTKEEVMKLDYCDGAINITTGEVFTK